LALLCVAIDFVSGPLIQFPMAYLAPIGLAFWYGGRAWGLAVVLPLCRLYFNTIWDTPLTLTQALINSAIRIIVFCVFAWLLDRASRQMRELRRMRLLEAMLGVCGQCRKIRDEKRDAWQPLEAYVAGHPAEFRHDLSPACAATQHDVFDRR
jgi:hypothetical protein